MARRTANPPLNIYLNGKHLGRFARARNGAVEFEYDVTWLTWENAIPVSLSLPLREDRYTGEAVLAVFENLLPDDREILRHVAQRSGATGIDSHSLLSQLGQDCVGALQFLPEDTEPGDVATINARSVSDTEIAAILGNLARNPLGITPDDAFRISIAGAQEKTALLRWNDAWHLPYGTTATTHILKPQIGLLPDGTDLSESVENEHFCMQLMSNLGLPAAQTHIADFAGRRVLVIERFDRRWAQDGRLLRIPQEDCCQALSVPPVRKYQSEGGPGIVEINNLLRGSDHPGEDRRLFFKAQLIFWLIAATDGHAKNFSLRLAPAGRFRLTPLYDVLSTQPVHDANQVRRNQWKLSMCIGDNRHYRMHQVAPRHFVQTAETCGLPIGTAKDVMQELAVDLPKALETSINDMPDGFPAALIESIQAGALNRLEAVRQAIN